MRLDLWLWLAGAVLALAAGVFRLLVRAPTKAESREPAHAPGWGPWAALALTCLGLAAIVAGVIWRSAVARLPVWPLAAWPGGASADGVALLASGALANVAWLLVCDARRGRKRDSAAPAAEEAATDRDRAVAEALALVGSCMLACLAIGAAWLSPPPVASTTSWIFALRVLTASLGLGAWLPALAAAARTLGRSTAGAPLPGDELSGATPLDAGNESMGVTFPVLTIALLLGAAWSLSTGAALWRGLSPEALLVAAWLLGGAYLIARRGARSSLLPAWVLLILAVCGTVVAVLEAWLTPLLLS